MRKFLIVTASLAVVMTTPVEAASFTCGKVMCRLVGVQNCGSLALALEWARKFPRTSAQPGAVVVQRRKGMDASGKRQGGHVSKIVQITKPCRAIVIDNRGAPYERNICKSLVAYVSPARAWTE
jgi:hypothetical protein